MLCQFCHKRFSIRDLTVDHIIPAAGGKNHGQKPAQWLLDMGKYGLRMQVVQQQKGEQAS